MAKWKCEICGNEFDNFHEQGFDNRIYCPLCYFKKENQELKSQLKGTTHCFDEEEHEKLNKQLKIQISAREEVCNRLESNWNKLKEYLIYKSERAVGEDEYVYDEIYNEMQELEQGSDE